ncbi:MAG: hypothetical protein ACRC6B_12715 [Fusobacteriaceae bacterium]
MEREEFLNKVLTFKEKISMVGIGEWVCIKVVDSKKFNFSRCHLSLYQKPLKIIAIMEESDLIKAIEDSRVVIGSKSKYTYREEKIEFNK